MLLAGDDDYDPMESAPTMIVGMADIDAHQATTVFSEEDRIAAIAGPLAGLQKRVRPTDEQTIAWKRKASGRSKSDPQRSSIKAKLKRDPRTRLTSARPARRGKRARRPILIASVFAVAGLAVGGSIGLAVNQDAQDTLRGWITGRPSATVSMGPIAASPPAQASPRQAEPETDVADEPAPVDVVAIDEMLAGLDEAMAEVTEPEVPPLVAARDAIGTGDWEAADEALARARSGDADPVAMDRMEAQLAVLRGDGELSISRLRTVADGQQDPTLFVALGQLLAQAERENEAIRAFATALSLDPASAHAHIGIARILVHDAELAAANRHLRQARELASTADMPDPQLEARIETTAAAISFERGYFGDASDLAARARALDVRSSEASLLLGRIAIERRQDPVAHLRAATIGDAPPPIALGLLATRVGHQEGCELAERYLERAPDGFDAPAMQRLGRRCEAGS